MNNEFKILECEVGSHLYGLNDENSDLDYSGIYIPDYLSLLINNEIIKERDESIISKTNNKNNKDAIDKKLYTYSYFLKLLYNNAPNIIEHLFIPDKNIIYKNDFYLNIQKNKELFLSKRLIVNFVGYANSQSHKMEIKTNKYNELKDIFEFLSELKNNKTLVADLMYNNDFLNMICKHNNDLKSFYINNVSFVTFGDLNIPKNITIKNALHRLKARLDKATYRIDDIYSNGYDTKMGMHLIRLLLECIQLLKTNEITFPLPESERNLLFDIKYGKKQLSEVIKMKCELLNEINVLSNNTILPENPDINKIDEFKKQEMTRYILMKQN